MGEGKSDRSGKRQRSTSRGGAGGKSSSDSEIAHGKAGKGKGRRSRAAAKERWPFLEGLTVDELARYRRRRVQDRPRDNLQPHAEPTTVQSPASEYSRAFGARVKELSKENVWPTIKDKRSEDYLCVEDAQPSYPMDFREHEAIQDSSPEKEIVLSQSVRDHETMETETVAPRFTSSLVRPSLIRRGTSLKCDGDFYADTETCSAYVPYEGHHRAELARRPTSLKVEGELDTMTEKCEKFIEWLNVSRPELMRIPTHLKMEGDLETATENQDKYIPFVGVRRPELLRRNTNLRLEGDTYLVPEYTDVFRDYSVKDRAQSMRPETSLRTGEDIFQTTESTDNFVHQRGKQARQTAEFPTDDDESDKQMRDQKRNRKKDEEMRLLVSKLEDLNGRPLEIPEYRDAYKDFPRERPKIARPDNEIGRADGSKISSPSHSRFSTKIDQDPEYKSKYLDYPRDRPVYRKPPPMLRSTMAPTSRRGSACLFGRIHPTHHQQEYRAFEPTSEVRSQYIPYGHVPRVEALRMPTNLRPEGNIDLQPEYRTAYCAQYDRHRSRDEAKTYGKGDCSPIAISRKNDNYWSNDDNNNGGRLCDRTIVPQEQDAFRILNARMQEENVAGKPPPASRRGSRLSQATRPTQPSEVVDRAIVRARSPSPTYRLHVCDVDNEPQGFGQARRSPVRSPSADRAIRHDDIARPYSPSFGRRNTSRQQDHRADDQPFVILDHASKTVSSGGRTRNIAVPITRGRPKTPTRWMPPWYDNTNTI